MRFVLPLSVLVLPCFAAACGSVIVDDDANAGATSTGAGGAPGTTSTSTSTTNTSSTSTSATTGSGGSTSCGGKLGGPCAPGELCVFGGHCGGTDGPGVCQTQPDACDADCPGVCGCDGQFYCSACVANSVGVDVNAQGGCADPGLHYAAVLFALDVDHMVLRAGDPARDVCLQIFLTSPAGNKPGFSFMTPDTWGVESALITAHASDCEAGFPNTLTNPQQANFGEGSVVWEVPLGLNYPCELSFKAKLEFFNAPAWVHPIEAVDAKGVKLEQGCF